jgi:hypothetical protein
MMRTWIAVALGAVLTIAGYAWWNGSRVTRLRVACDAIQIGEQVDNVAARMIGNPVWATPPHGVGFVIGRWWGVGYVLGTAECWVRYDQGRRVTAKEYRDPID